jgi:hypothetical protein
MFNRNPGNNSIYKTEKPGAARHVPYMAPMWDADGKLLPFNPQDDAQRGADYRSTPMPQFQNGRVIGVSGVAGNQFEMFTANNNKNDTFKEYALYGTLNRSPLSELFFSRYNMERIQSQLRYRVFVASGGKYMIGKQDNTELEVIMRAIILQYGKWLPNQLAEQVNELDRLVVEFAWPKILSEVEQYIGYIKNLEYLPNPIALPRNVSSKGTRTLSSVTTTF